MCLEDELRQGLDVADALVDLHLSDAPYDLMPLLGELYEQWQKDGRSPSPIARAAHRIFQQSDLATREDQQSRLLGMLRPDSGVLDRALLDLQARLIAELPDVESKRAIAEILVEEATNSEVPALLRSRALSKLAALDPRCLVNEGDENGLGEMLHQQLTVLLNDVQKSIGSIKIRS